MKAVLINYNFTPTWLEDYDFNTTIYDRSDDTYPTDWKLTEEKVETLIRTQNKGNVDYDKLGYLVEHYNDLPDVFLWGKSNLFKYITKEEFDKVKDNKEFTPLLTSGHNTYRDSKGLVCYYDQFDMYHERNDSWYVGQMESNFATYGDWARYLNLPNPNYLAFPPGGNFILTKDRVHRYSRDFYEKMRNTLDYCQLPAEAHMCERTYNSLWQ